MSPDPNSKTQLEEDVENLFDPTQPAQEEEEEEEEDKGGEEC